MKNKKIFIVFICSSIVIFTILVFLVSPLFEIKSIFVENNKFVDENFILKNSEIIKNNIFFVNKNDILKKLNKNAYIKDIEILKVFPNKINLKIVERQPIAYIRYTDDLFLYIDNSGVVLEALDFTKDRLPIITGIEVVNFSVGEVLKIEDKSIYDIILQITELVYEIALSSDIFKINLSDANDIHLIIYNIDFSIGGVDDINQKLLQVKAILEKIPNYKELKAVVDIKKGILQILT